MLFQADTLDGNATADRIGPNAHDGNLESHSESCARVCAYGRPATQHDSIRSKPVLSFSPEGPRDSNVTTRVRER